MRRLRIFGQQDKLRADRSRGRETWAQRGSSTAQNSRREWRWRRCRGRRPWRSCRRSLGFIRRCSNWKQELVKRAGELFARNSKAPAVENAQKVIDDLHRKIGQLQVERDFLAGQPPSPAC